MRFRKKNPSGDSSWCESPIGYHLSPNVQNIIANIYYRYFSLPQSIRVEYNEKKIGEINKKIIAQNEFGVSELEAIIETNLSSYKSRIVAEFAAINQIVDWLLEENEEVKRWEKRGGAGFLSDVLGDIFKYHLKNVWNKTGIRRKIERKLEEKNVDHIHNLIDYMNSYWKSDGYDSFLSEHPDYVCE
jgi:hypothetical protein